jgi:hypothetical protein
MSDQKVLDAWERASNPTAFEGKFWGQLQLDAWLCALVKGTGKVPFDPAVHERPATALDMDIIPLAEMNIHSDKLLKRNLIAESVDWSKTIWPSLRDLGIINLKDAPGKWFAVELVPQIKDPQYTVYKFVKLFASEAECRADYMATSGKQTLDQVLGPVPTQAAPAPAAPTNGNGAEKKAAFEFAKNIVGNVMRASTGKPLDEVMDAVGKKLAEYPIVSKYFTSQSPEVVELMMAQVK